MASPRKNTAGSGHSLGRPPTVKFAHRTSSGRVVSLSRDDNIDFSGEFPTGSGSAHFINYTVLMPPTPDNQPMTGDATSTSSAGGGQGSKPSPLQNGVASCKVMPMVPSQSSLMRTQTGDFDQTYGYGNAYWTQEAAEEGWAAAGRDTMGEVSMSDFMEQPWKPLTRKVPIPAAIISPIHGLLVVGRLVFLSLFLQWRIINPNKDAMWLWGISVVCEVWFAFSWILDQLPKLNPINRAADLSVVCHYQSFHHSPQMAAATLHHHHTGFSPLLNHQLKWSVKGCYGVNLRRWAGPVRAASTEAPPYRLFEPIQAEPPPSETDWDLRLACLLLFSFDCEAHFWQLYGDFLPSADDCTSLLMASKEELSELQNGNLAATMKEQHHRAFKFWEKN